MSSPTTYPTIGATEQGTFTFPFNITSDGVTLLPLASIVTFTLTIMDVNTGLFVNNQNKTNSKNLNGVTIAAGGTASWAPAPLDNSIVGLNPNSPDGAQELHEAIFQWTWLEAVTNRPLQLQTKVFINVEKFAGLDSPVPPGAGASQVTINLGVPGIQVWISTDPLGKVRAAGTLITDFRGFAAFQLVNGGQYYLWTDGHGFQPLLGVPFIASADISLMPSVTTEIDADGDGDGN